MKIPFEKLITLLIAPTGWGKTTLIFQIAQSSSKKIVFYSPLKALAQEFYIRALENGFNAFCPDSRKQLEREYDQIDFDILVLTYEKVTPNIFGKLIDANYLHIFDEIHLNQIWGDSFRPLLKDFIDIYLHLKLNCLFLSATISDEYTSQLTSACQELTIIKVDNYRLKKSPKMIYKFFNKHKMIELISHIHHTRTLVFCRYRKEVKELAHYYEKKGLKVLSCISGEVERFQMDLLNKECDMIIATSTLSHGVNLPSIDNIFILYPVQNKEMWVQMMGRAGRKGEDFQVFQMDKFIYDNFTPTKGMVHWFGKRVYLELWKWKAYLFTKRFTKSAI